MSGSAGVPSGFESEQHLVVCAQRGDQAALTCLLVDYEPLRRMILSIRRRVDPGNYSSVEDVTQAGRLAALSALPKFDPRRGVRFTTYAYRAIRRAIVEVVYPATVRLRPDTAAVLRFESVDQMDDGSLDAELSRRDPEFGIDPDLRRLEREAEAEAVRRFVSRLEAGQREIIHAVFWKDQSHTEVARRRSSSRPAVSKAVAKVLARGAEQLRPLAA